MYSASEAFHNAVANGAHQIALLIFDDAVFTNDDINVSAGIEFHDYFNTEEDISIGQALSNEISFNIFNDTGLLNNYAFGDFTATIGAQIGNDTVSIPTGATIHVQSVSHTYDAFSTSPYLKRDGYANISQPARKISSILIHNDTVYCRLENGAIVAYDDSTGSTKSVTMNNFMKENMRKWIGKGISYTKASGENYKLRICIGTNRRTYEFVPLGRFNAERPNVPYVNEIHFTCYDLMQRFEKDMPSNSDLNIAFPSTIRNLFTKMCNYVGVPYGSVGFINNGATISKRPDEFDNATMREVLQWIAEAAGSVARFDRDGILKMDWLRTTAQTVDETGYKEFNPYWYETQTIAKVDNRAADGSYENISGSGTGATYLIQDNPLLKGVS